VLQSSERYLVDTDYNVLDSTDRYLVDRYLHNVLQSSDRYIVVLDSTGRYLVDTIVTIAFFRCVFRVLATLAVTYHADRFASLPVFGIASVHSIKLGHVAVLCQSTTIQTYLTFQMSRTSRAISHTTLYKR